MHLHYLILVHVLGRFLVLNWIKIVDIFGEIFVSRVQILWNSYLEFLFITMTYIWFCYLCTEMLIKCIMFNDKNMLSKHTKHSLLSVVKVSNPKCFHNVQLCVCSVWFGCYSSDVCDGSVTAQFLHNPLAWRLSSKCNLTTDSICTNVNLILQMLDALCGNDLNIRHVILKPTEIHMAPVCRLW